MKNPYWFLAGTVDILVVTACSRLFDFFRHLSRESDLYRMHFVVTQNDIEAYLAEYEDIQVVVFDCEAIFDVEGIDSLLNRFGQSSPFVLLSQFETVGKRWLPLYEKAWAAIQRTKPAQVLSAIQDAFLTKIVAAGYTRLQGNETVGQCIKALRKTLPVTEEQWAASAGVKKSVLRRLWTETFFLRPSVALVLHNMYHNAFGLDHKISGESDIPAATPHFATNFSGLWDLALQKPVSSNRVA